MTLLSRCALAALAAAAPLAAQCTAPQYTAAGVVNSASYVAGWLAPNTFASIFGTNLAQGTANGQPGAQGDVAGVHVEVNSLPAFVSYASPDQVNFVVPSYITGTSANVVVVRDGCPGPSVTVVLHDLAPALFLDVDAVTVIALHQNGGVVSQQSPAHAGEAIVLFATGLGPYTMPTEDDFVPPPTGDWIALAAEFQVLVNGQAVNSNAIQYVGSAPLWIGLFQIDLVLPASVPSNPEIRIGLGSVLSPPGTVLPVD